MKKTLYEMMENILFFVYLAFNSTQRNDLMDTKKQNRAKESDFSEITHDI